MWCRCKYQWSCFPLKSFIWAYIDGIRLCNEISLPLEWPIQMCRRYFSFSLWVLEMLQVLKLSIFPYLTVTFKKWNCHICTLINENLFILEHIPLNVCGRFRIKRVEPHNPGGFTHWSFEERMLSSYYCNRMTSVSGQVVVWTCCTSPSFFCSDLFIYITKYYIQGNKK